MKIFGKIPAGTVLRVGLSLVFLWFGTQQFLDTTLWTGFVPDWVVGVSPFGAETLVRMNATVELVFGTALLLGIFTRVSAFILFLHMVHITLSVGYGSIGVRDFGLTFATLSAFLNGPDELTLDQLWKNRSQQK